MIRERERKRERETKVVTSSNETWSYGPSGYGVLAQTCVNSRNQEMCPRKYAEGNVMAHNNAPECQWPLPSLFVYISKPHKVVVTVRCRELDILNVFCYSERQSVIINSVFNDRWLKITPKQTALPASEGVALRKWQLFPTYDNKVMLTCFIPSIIYDVHSSDKYHINCLAPEFGI
jgi:hypothetical protein